MVQILWESKYSVTGLPCFIHIFYVCVYVYIHSTEPPGPPNGVMATASGPSILSVTWLAPLIKKDIVTSYVIDCDPVENGVDPPNTTRLTPSFVSFRDLSPNTTYECAVIARSSFGNSPAATAQVLTPPRESVYCVYVRTCSYFTP